MKALTAFFGLLLSLNGATQNWELVGRGPWGSGNIQTIYGDPVRDLLLAGGTNAFMMNAEDTVLCVGQAAWNGSRWDSLATRISPWGGSSSAMQTYWFFRFQGNLFASGNFPMILQDGTGNRGMARLNETSMEWEPLECLNPSTGGMSTLIYHETQNVVYATGYRGSLCGYPQSNVFVYTGSGFEEWPPYQQIPIPADNSDYVGAVFEYRGKTYMTGNFRDPYSTGTITFMRHNGASWEYVPGWPGGGNIKDYTFRNDTLYICGAFRMDQGAPGNMVAAFDGENWYDLGGGLTYPIPFNGLATDMQWWNDELVVCGQFLTAGGVPVDRLAKWDGQRWCGFPGTLGTTGTLNKLAVWRDTLYLCGSFNLPDQPGRGVVKWVGGDNFEPCSNPVGIHERPLPSPFTLAPNPTTGTLTLGQLPASARHATVRDLSGRLLYRSRLNGSTLDLAPLAQGTYLLSLEDDMANTLGTLRFVRE